jgi:general secretion pathway protein L
VFWTSKLLRRDRARGRIELRLSLVPKAALQSAIAVLHRIGAAPTAIEVPVPGGGSRHIALGAPQAGRDRLVATSCALVVLLLLAALVVPFVAQALTRGAVERRIAELKPRTAEVQALRDRIAAGAAGTDAIDSERARTGDALQVVATITELMPDDTVLSELSLHQGKLAISGHARSAAQLIPALAASPAIRNPAFSAPVIRSPDGNVDVFTVHAELSP